jgi:ElaB/YqjD/DUF883 family membrane-anchored ribosome-binding protein
MANSHETPYSSESARYTGSTDRSTAGTARSDIPARGSGLVGRARERATAQLTTQKDKATDTLGSVARAVRQSTQQLRNQQQDTLAGYVEQAADQIDRLSQRLRDKDVGELLEDAQRFARRQPALFIGSAFAVGLVGARFLKSSNTHQRNDRSGYGAAEYGGVSVPRRASGYSESSVIAYSAERDLNTSQSTASGRASEGMGSTPRTADSGAASTIRRGGNPPTERS